ncbi:MAG: carboxypeptidase regulatory-like domain-containing protein [Nitrospirae bacterium]|nr:MAG: carboxypeptidase regulatory-like domain-containing protein [Nitrospirota bacterium]
MLMTGLIVSLSLIFPAFGWAYEEIPVTDGGTLTGTVTLVGKVPKPKGYNLVTFPDPYYCGRISDGNGWRLLQPFKVGSHSEFQNVVVFIKNIRQGKKFDYTPPRIEALDCQFVPYITIVRNNNEVQVVNMDPVMHDIQAYETSELGARVLFNVPLPMSPHLRKTDLMAGKHVKNRAGKVMIQHVRMRKGRNVFVMQCGFHAYMESWGLAVDNPYFAKTDRAGHFTITDIPPGTYKVVAWHPLLQQEYTVTIQPHATTTLNITFQAPKGRLYANEAQTNTRFGMELLGKSKIIPTVKRQTY